MTSNLTVVISIQKVNPKHQEVHSPGSPEAHRGPDMHHAAVAARRNQGHEISKKTKYLQYA